MIERIVTLLYLSGEAMSLSQMATILETTQEAIQEVFPALETQLQNLGLRLLREGDTVSIVTSKEQATLVERFWKEELRGELTPATLQVLTIIAYLGSATRQIISFIRGVQSAQSIRTLSVRGLIRREGEMCYLTGESLKQLGITSVEELPDYTRIHSEMIEKIKSIESQAA